ncbi:hypothetical protein L7F22_046777 [Adiantum nelumboides]|nr:hypothetical protein [Adiantum nelumboides]
MNIPPAPPSSLITPFSPASTPRTPPSPSPLDLPKSPPALTSPQQQQFSAEPIEIPTSLQEETKQPRDRTEEEEKQTDDEQQKPAEINLPIPIIQLEEPTNEEEIQESQLTRKEAQNHELIKNEKKMKEQLKYEDAKFQKLTASYNTVKSTLTALLQNQESASAVPSTSDSATTAQHEAKVKQLELELARAKADLEAVGSLVSTSQIHQAETHLHIQQPLMLEMPEFQSPQEEEQPRPAPEALDIREQMEQEVEDMPEGPAKKYLLYKKKVMESAALAFLQPDEQIKDFGNDFLPLPLMRHEGILWKEKMRPAVPRNEEGRYESIPLISEEAEIFIEDHPRWRKKWLSERPRDLTNFHNTPQYLQIDPTYCSMPRRRSWAKFQKWKGKNKALLNYPVLSAQQPPTVTYVVNTLNLTIQLLREVPDLTCHMLVKIARMIVTCIQVFRDTEDDDHPWNLFLKGRRGICWNLKDSPPRWIIMAIYSCLMYLPSHFLQTFEKAFVTGFFKINTQIFHPMAKDLKARSPYFRTMVSKIGEYGPSYVPPSSERLRTSLLDREKLVVEQATLATK